jgi:propanediol dehydratase small subunit
MLRRLLNRSLVAIVTMLTLLVLAGLAGPEDPTPPAGEGATGEATTVPPPAAEPSPLMRDIQAALDAGDAAVAALERQLAQATDERAALALQRQIEDLRVGVEIRIMEIQARHARQDGRPEQAAAIEAAIAAMTAPRPRGIPVERPLPNDER